MPDLVSRKKGVALSSLQSYYCKKLIFYLQDIFMTFIIAVAEKKEFNFAPYLANKCSALIIMSGKSQIKSLSEAIVILAKIAPWRNIMKRAYLGVQFC